MEGKKGPERGYLAYKHNRCLRSNNANGGAKREYGESNKQAIIDVVFQASRRDRPKEPACRH